MGAFTQMLVSCPVQRHALRLYRQHFLLPTLRAVSVVLVEGMMMIFAVHTAVCCDFSMGTSRSYRRHVYDTLVRLSA